MRKIVILDGNPLDQDGLSWEPLQALGSVAYFSNTPEHKIIDRCQEAHIVITNKVPFFESTIAQCPKLEHIAVTATGVNMVDLAFAKSKGITVSNVPAYGPAAVAQHSVALLLALTNRVGPLGDFTKSNGWAKHSHFAYWDQAITGLEGKTIGLYGYGEIAKRVSKIAHAFGMEVLVVRSSNQEPEIGRLVELEVLIRQSDIISLHAPLNSQNEGLFNQEAFRKMKKSAYLINTARGPLINENDLYIALKNREIAGAGLDVLCQEPPEENHPLYQLENCIITPHMAWAAVEARQNLMHILFANIKGFCEGKPQNIVN
ncbi:D-2-hydroxyacid dehydrogenase [Persicobacter sp. CCB-QB2]|uniref:D-2-hydroxyacid dehydrogenase n=1 Tax=Persicobacter sp. CCB-QB2 TaxID=1561025 RepID=UPI0006A9A3D4|nr:D-2-hydroxyacid dehydrogenase [Persicobacter sp. CCB-QB2]